MTPGEKTTFIIISDLHLAAGSDPVSGQRDPMDSFVQDTAFAHWLDHVREGSATSGGSHRLLLLGDFFDFPRVRLSGADGASSEGAEAQAIAKLDRIAAGHPAVFAALGRWLGAGNPLDLVPGNHDVELMRSAVHRHLSGLLARAADLAQFDPGLNVSPWIYHVPGVLYAEHGQQYHDLNSFPALVWLDGQDAARDMPLGAAVDTFAQRVTAKLGPAVDAPDSIARLLRNVARTGPRGAARVAPDMVRLAAVVGRHLITRWLPRHHSRRERYRIAVLPGQAKETGIPVETLARIDRLAESTANRLPARVAAASWRQLGRRPASGTSGTRLAADYLVRAATEIHRLLDDAGAGTAFYVFGHSHRAGQQALGVGPSAAVYLNSGTWAGQAAGTNPPLTFVVVTWDPALGEATAALQHWNDHLRQIEPIGTPARVRPNATGAPDPAPAATVGRNS